MKHRYIILLLAALLITAYVLVVPSNRAPWYDLSHTAREAFARQSVILHSREASSSPQLWISPAAPAKLRQLSEGSGIRTTIDGSSASIWLDQAGADAAGAEWVYALVAPFPTIPDGVTSHELLSSWKGFRTGPFAGRPLLMEQSTLSAFTAAWGPPAAGAVRAIAADQLLDVAWSARPSWAIVPFEALTPRWKVLTVDGQSPVRKGLVVSRLHLMQTSFDYPLTIRFVLTCSGSCPPPLQSLLPSTNRDPSKMTTVVTTGVTALVRATAFRMNIKGITYPGRDIQDWLAGADITHISNEVPFAANCPPPNPDLSKLVFCSDPRYIELLKYIGTDVVELTGNHYADYGPLAMLLTLKIYGENGMSYYGGGADLNDAQKPLLLQSNGNKVAFIGCNTVDIGRLPTATSSRPGAAPCDYDYMTRRIRELHDQGYLVIASFQYYESYSPTPFEAQMHDFRLMADAGAVVVQGSQAHNPQTLEFRGGSLIHYGLGNLFFDQMGDAGNPTRHEFIDRHVFYDGRYISTELLTAELEDYARPRPMTPEERSTFLSKYFAASGW